MKRVLLLLLLLLQLCGCSALKKATPPVPDLNFSGNINVTYNGFELECTVDNKIASSCVITVTKPELISGLTMTLENGDCVFKFGNVEYALNSTQMKQTEFVTSFAEALKNVLSTTSYEKLENGNWQYVGQTSVGKFIIVQDSDSGYPVSLRIPDANLYVKFSNMKSNINGG